MGVIPFDDAYVFDVEEDIYRAHEILHVLNDHTPIKENKQSKPNKPIYKFQTS